MSLNPSDRLMPDSRIFSAAKRIAIGGIMLALAVWLSACRAQDETPSDNSGAIADGHPVSKEDRERLRESFEQVLVTHPAPQEGDPNAVQIHSRRGDAYFFLGQFGKSVAEYRHMVRIQPAQDVSHWRLGIALFFADQPHAAAEQFEKYHSFDDVDRENGIWRYLSQYRAAGAEKASKELLRYEKDDREPFPAVYRLFDGTLTPEAALDAIPNSLPRQERESRLFYTELYIGMHFVVQQDEKKAVQFLRQAVSRTWPQKNGFGPDFMWHVARLQYELLRNP